MSCQGTTRTMLFAKRMRYASDPWCNESLPSYVAPLSVTVKSTPVWRMAAVLHVSPSIPTQAEAELPLLPEGTGTVKVPVTEVKVACRNKSR